MEVQIYIVSLITYLLLFNTCLTFKLKITHNIVIISILTVSMLLIEKQMGSLFVIPMFIMVFLYIGKLKREDWALNLFLLIFSYTLLVIIDNLTHLVWSIVGLSIQHHWPLYMLINYPVYFFICRFMSKKVVVLKKKEGLLLSPKVLVILGVQLIIYMIIFVIHIAIVEQAGSSPPILLGSVILYIAYFSVSFLVVAMTVREYDANAKMMLRQNSYDNLREYMVQIEELYQNMRGFKHDYANIMVSMGAYIETGDMGGLKNYYNQQIYPISIQLNKAKDVITRLHNLEIIELKSLLAVKINHAMELDIEVCLELTEKIKSINMEKIDLIRIVGILLDNAIEACQECKNPYIGISIIRQTGSVALIVKNTYIKHEIAYHRLGKPGVSSKGERRGIGLYNIRTIVNAYDHVIMDTEFSTEYFTQLLEIYETEEDTVGEQQ